MRLTRLALVVLLCSGMLVTVGAAPALACSCAYTQTRDFVDNADEIVSGTLVRMVDPPQRPVMRSTDPITYTVAVDQVYLGDVGAEVEFISAMWSDSCGLDGMVVDRRYVVFLNGGGQARTANLCGGTAPASPRLEAAVERLTGPPTQPAASAAEPSPSDMPEARPADDPARTEVPAWAIATGILGVALLGGAALLRRRRAR